MFIVITAPSAFNKEKKKKGGERRGRKERRKGEEKGRREWGREEKRKKGAKDREEKRRPRTSYKSTCTRGPYSTKSKRPIHFQYQYTKEKIHDTIHTVQGHK